jgi:Holliday junction resolvase
MTAYRRGIYREERTADRLRSDGYLVMRAPGSHGQPDLVAIKPGQVLALQVKAGTARLDGDWWNELYAVALRAGAIPLVADWPSRGVLRLRRITGPHAPRSKHWPCVPFVVDELGEEAPW